MVLLEQLLYRHIHPSPHHLILNFDISKIFHETLEYLSLNTVHETPSLQGGSVSEPLYLGEEDVF